MKNAKIGVSNSTVSELDRADGRELDRDAVLLMMKVLIVLLKFMS